MELILDLMMVAALWGSVALLIWGGILGVRDTFAAERRNAATARSKFGRKGEQDRPHSRLVLGD